MTAVLVSQTHCVECARKDEALYGMLRLLTLLSFPLRGELRDEFKTAVHRSFQAISPTYKVSLGKLIQAQRQ